jgi:hypothetical protein
MTAEPPLPASPARIRPRHPLRRLVDQELSVAWFILFVVGDIVLFSRSAGAAVQLQGILLPCLLMALYVLLGLRSKNRNTTKFADSVYFMGFLWTLSALIDAVLVKERVDELFDAFGFALITTGLGMFLRTLLLQFYETIPDQLDDAQDALDKRMATLNSELEITVARMRQFRTDAAKTLDDEVRQLAAGLHATREVLENTHREAATTALTTVRDTLTQVQAQLTTFDLDGSGFRADVDEFTKAIRAATKRVSTAGEGLGTSLDAFAVSFATHSARALDVSFGELTGRIARQAAHFEVELKRYDAALERWRHLLIACSAWPMPSPSWIVCSPSFRVTHRSPQPNRIAALTRETGPPPSRSRGNSHHGWHHWPRVRRTPDVLALLC